MTGPDGAFIDIPPGALTRSSTASIRRVATGFDIHLDAPMTAPVTVGVPTGPIKEGESVFLIHYTDAGPVIEDSRVKSGVLVAQVASLSVFGVLKCLARGISKAVLKCLVKEGAKSAPSRLLKKFVDVLGCGDVLDIVGNAFGDEPCRVGETQEEIDDSKRVGRTQPNEPPPTPMISNFQVVVYESEPGRVGVSYTVGWQAGRDPVTCHFFIDGREAYTAHCGTSSSRQFYGLSEGEHSFYATVSDKYGVYSAPSPTVRRIVSYPQPPPEPQRWREQQATRGADTFRNYHNASGKGPRIEPREWVTVTCRVYDPYISSNSGGWWYLIYSSPWNDEYYAPASTFWNGDVEGQEPYTHNVDENVRVC